MSSIKLIIANMPPLKRAKYRVFSIKPLKNNIVIPVYQVITIANPPPTGVGFI
jgi:hypothetical protein